VVAVSLDVDVASASMTDNKVAWYENANGKGAFGPQNIINESVNGAIFVGSIDLDGDMDMDVFSASMVDNIIAWYRNRMPPIADFEADTSTGPAPWSVRFRDKSRGGRTAWDWDFGDGTKSSDRNPVHTFGSPGAYPVSLTVSGPDGSDLLTRDSCIVVTGSSGIDEDILETPGSFRLNPNYPNPFNPNTEIRYDVKDACHVALILLNARGQVVRTLVDSHHIPGTYLVELEGGDLPSGVYFFRIRMGGFEDTKKMIKSD
jgi:hypothetical protein